MILAHRIRLDPTKKQEAYFWQACGTARFVWNWALAEWNRQYDNGERPNARKLAVQFNATKYTQFPWLRGMHRDTHSQPFIDLGRAFSKFFQKRAGRPTFKTKNKCRDAFYVANDQLGYTEASFHVRLPRIGVVRMTEPLRFAGKIMNARVTRQADCWFIAFQVEVGAYRQQRTGNGVVGADLGISTLATLSDGEQVQAPKPLSRFLDKFKRESRRLSRKERGSRNRQKQRVKLARLHSRISNIRKDCLHKLTTKLCRENQAVVVENLCVSGMMRNRRLSRAISDLGFYEFRRQLEYKGKIFGTEVILAPRFFPSTKKCSGCGNVKETMLLSERVYRCDCGREMDRDLNAAVNLHQLYTPGFGEINACGQEGSGSDSG